MHVNVYIHRAYNTTLHAIPSNSTVFCHSVVSHVEQVLAIELLEACQALEFHRPRTTTAPLEDVYKLVRTVIK